MNQDDHNTPKIGCVNHDCDKCKAQQPVAYVYEREVDGFGLRKDVKFLKPVEVGSDLYTSPPASKPWVGLTEQERNDLEDYCEMIIGKAAFEAIEAKLREKNAAPRKPLTDEQRNWIVATCPTPRHIIDTVEKMHGIKGST